MMTSSSIIIKQASQIEIRMMAGILYEFTMPGMRLNYNKRGEKNPPIMSNQTYKQLRMLFQKFENYYYCPQFTEYIQNNYNNNNDDDNNNSNSENILIRLPKRTTSIKPIQFEDLMTNYRCSQAIYTWMYSGNTSWRFGNYRRRKASYVWMISNDKIRRNCLLNIDKENLCTLPITGKVMDLNQLTKDAYGNDYQMRIRKLINHLRWLCKQAHLERKQSFSGYNLTLLPEDADYLIKLYDLHKQGEKKKKK